MIDRDELVSFVQDVIRIPSYSGQEGAVADFLHDKMLSFGFDEVQRVRYGSILGCIHGNKPGPTILMDGHIDTVDVIDSSEWAHDPFGAEMADGKIYGRGTSDMKGSVAAMIYAASSFSDHDFAGDIYISCTVHEECFEGVSSREITKLVHPDFVIIGEATSTTVKIGQRGRAEIVVETEGISCHSSNPEKGLNAVVCRRVKGSPDTFAHGFGVQIGHHTQRQIQRFGRKLKALVCVIVARLLKGNILSEIDGILDQLDPFFPVRKRDGEAPLRNPLEG